MTCRQEEKSRKGAPPASYYEADGLGSITSLTSSAGAVAQTYTYDSYGNLTASSGSVSNPISYTGREFDNETGLYYYRARYYDPTVGRFIGEDPVGFQGGVNFYSYVTNTPTMGKDPSGLWDTYTHSALYWNALKACGVDNTTIYNIQKASALLDLTTQFPWQSPIHSMKAPGQSAAAALKQRDDWISGNLRAARTRLYEGPTPYSTGGWEDLFANALHTITDSTSPAHMQDGNPITWPSNIPQHGGLPDSIETWKNMTPGLMQQNIKAIQAAWEGVAGQKCGCQQ